MTTADLHIVPRRSALDDSPTLRTTLADLLASAESSLYEHASLILRQAAREGRREVPLLSLCLQSGLTRGQALEWLASEGLTVRVKGRWWWRREAVCLR